MIAEGADVRRAKIVLVDVLSSPVIVVDLHGAIPINEHDYKIRIN
jgi:hypothetical protein